MAKDPAAMTVIEKIRGKRTRDIRLPNDTGRIDPSIQEAEDNETSWNPVTNLVRKFRRTGRKMSRAGGRTAGRRA